MGHGRSLYNGKGKNYSVDITILNIHASDDTEDTNEAKITRDTGESAVTPAAWDNPQQTNWAKA